MVGGRSNGHWSHWVGRLGIGAACLGLASEPAPATACPDCAAGVRAAVRRGIFNESFGANLLATLAPFGIFLGAAVMVHSGGLIGERRRADRP